MVFFISFHMVTHKISVRRKGFISTSTTLTPEGRSVEVIFIFIFTSCATPQIVVDATDAVSLVEVEGEVEMLFLSDSTIETITLIIIPRDTNRRIILHQQRCWDEAELLLVLFSSTSISDY